MQIAMRLIQWNPQMLTSFVQEVHCMTVRRDDCFFRPCSTAEGPSVSETSCSSTPRMQVQCIYVYRSSVGWLWH